MNLLKLLLFTAFVNISKSTGEGTITRVDLETNYLHANVICPQLNVTIMAIFIWMTLYKFVFLTPHKMSYSGQRSVLMAGH